MQGRALGTKKEVPWTRAPSPYVTMGLHIWSFPAKKSVWKQVMLLISQVLSEKVAAVQGATVKGGKQVKMAWRLSFRGS